MSDPSLALQNAIEAALRSSADLVAAMGLAQVRLYTLSPPDDAPFPYIVIGEDQIVDDETECAASSEAFTTVHVWSRVEDDVSASRAQAKAIAALVRATLNAPLPLVGFVTTEWRFETARHLTDPDQRTAHSVVEHRYLIDPA
ncbi:DUF3168 domain-containing protein [uncultured Brevundimonas sp.]|uniref:DUF3168 domain-containing protein n=1 Tax=uncultured Brevundimonas sp. TaxID=213418 RepID=UPI0025CBCFA6|nr:DUF3168 domain-containing protein [uncultured Brevundimonas sp.]